MNEIDLKEIVEQLEFSKKCRRTTKRIYCCPVLREEDVDHIIHVLVIDRQIEDEAGV